MTVSTARSVPADAQAVGFAVAEKGSVPRQLGLSRTALKANGFEGKSGQILAVPSADGLVVAVGIGDPGEVDANELRRGAAAFARSASKYARLATTLTDVDGVDPAAAGQAVAEGVLLASYRYVGLKNDEGGASKLTELTVVAKSKRAPGVGSGAETGRIVAGAAAFARELANMPPTYLNAKDIATKAVELGPEAGLAVEVFDKDDLTAMGCGGMLGVNRGSTEPPRLVKLSYTPDNPSGHLAMVGKGIMYDSGGISIKGSDAFHQVMKMDMSGAAAVLSAMSVLQALGCSTKVTAWLMCTDNMPSGSALKLGDVLTMRNGKTVEIHNTDAEGRLVLADGLSLAVEEEPDAIVDIATLTGAVLGALGPEIAGLLGTNEGWTATVKAASDKVDEPTWQLPLEKQRYRKLLDSVVADMKNIGGPYAGTITASIFLSEFTGDVPYAHLDIAGPMKVDSDQGI
ncbi:leucyl aminopeptidase family protein, partial [Ilumatobacter sp.]|uniref:leucyl aminopeptidase family protein n=1 Tax=Ilumatobacter sp. TaxID=1967498 RepID=UPI003C594CEB